MGFLDGKTQKSSRVTDLYLGLRSEFRQQASSVSAST